MLRKIFSKFRGLLGPLLVSILACEIVLRLCTGLNLIGGVNPVSVFLKEVNDIGREEGASRLFQHSQNSRLIWEPVPGAKRGHIRINSSGFRGPEYSNAPKPGVKRIAFMGDSEGFSMRLEESETLAGRIESILQQKGVENEVLNFSVPGYGTRQEAELYRQKVLNFNPEAVILYYVFNDPENSNVIIFPSGMTSTDSYLWLFSRFIYMGLKDRMFQAKDPVEHYQKLYASPKARESYDLILSMARESKQKNIKFIVVIAPEMIGFDNFKNYPYLDIHSKIKEALVGEVVLVDPISEFIKHGKSPQEYWVTSSDYHKNRVSNDVIAFEGFKDSNAFLP